MRALLNLQKKLYPDLLEAMQQRYTVLAHVDLFQPIGRRGLAEHTKLTERIVRSEVIFLQEQGLISITSKGMHMTNEGKLILDQLADFMGEITGLGVLEQQIRDKLQMEHVIIVPGNSDEDTWVKQEMGKACVSYLKANLSDALTIAVTGGTTMAAVADVMTPLNEKKQTLFVPARGGIGEKVENQANTIAAEMARKAGGDYRLLYVPDPLSESSYQTLMHEPAINNILQMIKGADVILHGIGDALTMAARRKTPGKIIGRLKEGQAVSESFGYYFDAGGDIVHQVRSIGIQLSDINRTRNIIAIAGGKSKACAIASYFKQGKSDLLITDEAAAEQILRGSSTF